MEGAHRIPDGSGGSEGGEFESPFRVAQDTWEELKKAYPPEKGPKGAKGKGSSKKPKKPAGRAKGKGSSASAEESADSTRNDAPPEASEAASVWVIALRKAERLGAELGENKYALLCPWDAEHTSSDGTVDQAAGSCVVLPPMEGSDFGFPHCSHGHCANRTLKDWILAVGTTTFADAIAEARGWRVARTVEAVRYLAHGDGVSIAARRPLKFANDPPAGDGEPDPETTPFMWIPGQQLATFDAHITAIVAEADASGPDRVFYEIVTQAEGQKNTLRVATAEYSSLAWASQIGNGFIRAGRDTKDTLREAIQFTSRPIPRRKVFTFTGWHEVNGREVYLHAGGAIGPDGPDETVLTRFDDPLLSKFRFPVPAQGDALRTGIRACMGLAWYGEPEVAIPLFSLTWRSPLGRSKGTLYIAAEQDTGKSRRAALAQSHFGAAWDANELPVSLPHATAASINKYRSRVGDALFVADDYLITGNAADDAKMNGKVDHIVRAQFNGAGAKRLARDSQSVLTEAPPRSSGVITGEALPPGHSLRSRSLVTQMNEKVGLTIAPYEALARAGVYASTMAAFVQWLAPQIKEIRARLPEESATQAKAIIEGLPAGSYRSASLLGDLRVGVYYFLKFARHHNAITSEEAQKLWAASKAISRSLLGVQTASQKSQDPVLRTLALWAEGLRAKECYLTTFAGGAPDQCHMWGWRPQSDFEGSEYHDRNGDEVVTKPHNVPGRTHVGYIQGEEVWLLANVAFGVAQRMSNDIKAPLGINRDELVRRLSEKGLLLSTEMKSRNTYTTRKMWEGHSISGLLHVKATSITEGLIVSEPLSVDPALS